LVGCDGPNVTSWILDMNKMPAKKAESQVMNRVVGES
jgi:hypothetical protein